MEKGRLDTAALHRCAVDRAVYAGRVENNPVSLKLQSCSLKMEQFVVACLSPRLRNIGNVSTVFMMVITTKFL